MPYYIATKHLQLETCDNCIAWINMHQIIEDTESSDASHRYRTEEQNYRYPGSIELNDITRCKGKTLIRISEKQGQHMLRISRIIMQLQQITDSLEHEKYCTHSSDLNDDSRFIRTLLHNIIRILERIHKTEGKTIIEETIKKAKSHRKASNIKWDTDNSSKLPTEIALPSDITDKNGISEYLFAATGFHAVSYDLTSEYNAE